MKKSPKENALEKALLHNLEGKALLAAEWILQNPEIHAMQEYANVVSIKRLGFNDHGPVHMRKAALNAIEMFALLTSSGIKLNLESEHIGTRQDSQTAVVAASLLHDLGMTVARDHHEIYSIQLALPYVDQLLSELYPDTHDIRIAVRSLIVEGIAGHMATRRIHSLEAGLVLIGDGCDMEKGRARIPSLMNQKPRVGDIHKYSASSIERVHIEPGEKRPIRIRVEMGESVGFFQIEEVLHPKIASSPVKRYIELVAGVKGEEPLRYL